MKLIDERPEDILADMHLALLRIVYPGYRFTTDLRRTGRRYWTAVRRNLVAGLHAVVTDDLDELLAVLGPPDLSYKPAECDLAEVVALCARRTASSPPAADDASRVSPPDPDTTR